MIDDINPEDIRNQVSMWDVLDALDLDHPSPNPNGVKILALHRHETEPSLHIYDDHWHDYGTSTGGDVISFVQEFFGCSWRKALLWLAGQTDIEEGGPVTVRRPVRQVTDLTYRYVTESDQLAAHRLDVEFFLFRRWFDTVTLDDLAQVYARATEHALWIPHLDADGRVIGVKVRAWSGAKSAMQGSTFTTRLWPASHTATTTLVVCEGESDALALARAMRDWPEAPAVVGLPSGVGTIRPEWFQDLGHSRLLWLLDNDDAGQRAKGKAFNDAIVQQFQDTWWMTDLLPQEHDVVEALAADLGGPVLDAIKEITT